MSRWHSQKALDELRNAGFLHKTGPDGDKRHELTDPAEKLLENSGGVSAQNPSGSPSGSSSWEVSTNIHDLAYTMPLHDDSLIFREDRETVLKEFKSLSYDAESEEFCREWNRFHIRISGDSVTVYDKSEYHGFSPRFLKNQAVLDLEELREFLEDELGLRFLDRSIIRARVFSQDVGIEDHPLVRAVSDADGLSLEDTWHGRDEDGDLRVKLDVSHGDVGELEASMRGPESSNKRLQESDIQFELDDLARRVDNKRGTRLLRELSDFLDESIPEGFLSGDVEDSDDCANWVCLEDANDTGLNNDDTERINNDVELRSVRVETSVRGFGLDSKREDNVKSDGAKFEFMSGCENLEDLDVGDLPGLKLQDSAGRTMTVYYIDLPASSGPQSKDSKGDCMVVLRSSRRGRKKKMALEDLRSAASSGKIQVADYLD